MLSNEESADVFTDFCCWFASTCWWCAISLLSHCLFADQYTGLVLAFVCQRRKGLRTCLVHTREPVWSNGTLKKHANESHRSNKIRVQLCAFYVFSSTLSGILDKSQPREMKEVLTITTVHCQAIPLHCSVHVFLWARDNLRRLLASSMSE